MRISNVKEAKNCAVGTMDELMNVSSFQSAVSNENEDNVVSLPVSRLTILAFRNLLMIVNDSHNPLSTSNEQEIRLVGQTGHAVLRVGLALNVVQ